MCPDLNLKIQNSSKDQSNISSLKPLGPRKMFIIKNYLDELWDTELKRAFTKFIKELEEFKEDTKKQFTEITKLKETT